ncbi:zinc finger protein 79-like [Poeciliopsis prolifica]|uniref:zinc finger protein 79-like n=1 Tax=Poeciliopsis prolifica TaxID=188132 RepID=UPI002413F8B2|nr:zinc finger protein 79-like [Poeciliopsis prolifica]
MFHCSRGGSDPLNMSKSDFLRGIITEKLSTAAREILAVVERTVADYEQEASSFRREIDRQRRQLELLQPLVRLDRADVEEAERHKLTGNHSDEEEEEEDPVAISKLIQEDLQDPDYEIPPRSGFSRVQTARRRKRTGQTQVSDSQNHMKKTQVKIEVGQHVPSESAAPDPVVLKSHETGFQTSFVGAVNGSASSADQNQEAHQVTMESQMCWNQVVKVEVKQEEGSVAQLTLDPDPTDDDKSGLQSSSPEGESDPGGDGLSVSSTSELDDLESDDDSSDSSSDTDESLDESVDSNQDVEPKTQRKTDKLTCRVWECGWYRQLGSLISHIWNHVNEPHGVCGVCGEKFESVEALKQHLPSHKKGYSCWICGKYLLSSVTLNRHIAKHATDAPINLAAETPIKCNVCSKTFSTVPALNGHSRVHLEKRPAGCHLCPKSFDLKSDLVTQRKRPGGVYGNASTGSLGFSCSLCGKTFALESSLKTHEKTHATSDCPFTCQVCHKTFQTYQNLTNHKKTHGTVGSFLCSLCNMSFLSEDTLKVHMIVHAKTPYKCSRCGRCFKRLAYLVNHIKTHSAFQQCVCTICGQVSHGLEALEDHMRIHTGEIPVEQNLHLDPWYENTPEEPQGSSLMSGGQERHSMV